MAKTQLVLEQHHHFPTGQERQRELETLLKKYWRLKQQKGVGQEGQWEQEE